MTWTYEDAQGWLTNMYIDKRFPGCDLMEMKEALWCEWAFNGDREEVLKNPYHPANLEGVWFTHYNIQLELRPIRKGKR